MPLHSRAHIAVFARAPELGKVKTRLIPALGAESALALYTAMLARTLSLVKVSGLAPMSLWVTSNPSHEKFITYCSEREIYLQYGADLGQRMAHCVEELLSKSDTDYLVLIGTDCPALTKEYLQAALTALQGGQDCVLGPARDGGYVLIGLRRPIPALFQDIDWSTSRVLAQTLDRIASMKVRLTLLEEQWDVDESADLALLATLQPPMSWS